MYHETSLCISSDVRNELLIASNKINMPVCAIAIDLIKLVISSNFSVKISEYNVEYQNNPSSDRLNILRYRLRSEDYSLFINARLNLRCSVSKLLLIGFLLFFKKYLSKHLNHEKQYILLYNYTKLCSLYSICIDNFLRKVKKRE